MEKEIHQLIQNLQQLERHTTAKEIERIHNLSVFEYSTSIYSYKTSVPFEPALDQAFRKELSRLDYKVTEIEKIITSLRNGRVIQTGPHVVPSCGPRMLCLEWQSTVAAKEDEYYVAGMYSGIPFSNIFYPGHLTFNSNISLDQVLLKSSEFYNDCEKNQKVFEDSFGLKERRLTLIPSKMQDELVYRSEMTDKTRKTISELTPTLQAHFNHPSLQENSYTKWAIQSNQSLISYALKKTNLVYLDINEVTTHYLTDVLTKPDHIMYKILFDPKTRAVFTDTFKDENIFMMPYMSGKYSCQEGMKIEGEYLIGKHTKLELNPESIIDALINKRLCSGLLISFTLLAFINGFKCLGSFRQAIYLPQYKDQWLASGLLSAYDFLETPACNITASFPSDTELNNIRPLDLVLGKQYKPNEHMLVGELILSVAEKFLL